MPQEFITNLQTIYNPKTDNHFCGWVNGEEKWAVPPNPQIIVYKSKDDPQLKRDLKLIRKTNPSIVAFGWNAIKK